MNISNIMTSEIISVEEGDTLKDTAQLFENIKIRHLPVVSGDILVGIVSRSDVSRIHHFCTLLDDSDGEILKKLESISIGSLMSKPVTIEKDKSINEAASLFCHTSLYALPVVENQKLIGIVTSTDIIKYLADKQL